MAAPAVKQEPETPCKRRCLNQDLLAPKQELASPSHSQTDGPHRAPPIQDEQAVPAPPATEQANTANQWKGNLKISKLAITLSSPSPSAGNRLPKPLTTPKHARRPPPLHGTDNGPRAKNAKTTDDRGNDLAEPAPAPGDTGGTGHGCKSSRTKQIHNRFEARKSILNTNQS